MLPSQVIMFSSLNQVEIMSDLRRLLPELGLLKACVCALQENTSAELSRVFGSYGFHVSLVAHKEISSSVWSKNRSLTEINEQDYGVELLFVAKQLRLSDHQASFRGLIW